MLGIELSKDIDILKALAGGALIALSSTAFIALTGKITGISGILHTLISAKNGAHRGWRFSYLAGLVGAGAILVHTQPAVFGKTGNAELKPFAAALAGVLVGFGARMSGGCTSGHGICGLPRLSLRSVVAVGTFMSTGALAAAVAQTEAVRPLIERAALAGPIALAKFPMESLVPTAVAFLAAAVLFRKTWFRPFVPGQKLDDPLVHAAAAGCGLVFGLGLGLSGMTNPAKVSGFLHPFGAGGWDPSLAGVMAAGVGINLLTFRWLVSTGGHPILGKHLGAGEEPGDLTECLPMGACSKNTKVDYKLVLGAALFGLGWGLGGVCPGPSIVSLPAGGAVNAWILPGMVAGMAAYEAVGF